MFSYLDTLRGLNFAEFTHLGKRKLSPIENFATGHLQN